VELREEGRIGGTEVIRDFHLHTHYSDGLYPPRKLVEAASRQGVRELAITDHNSIKGLPEGKEAAEDLDITMVSGVEVSAQYHAREVHILGYGFSLKEVEASSFHQYLSRIRDANNLWARKVAKFTQNDPLVVRLGGGERAVISLTIDEVERFRQSTQSYFHVSILVKEKLEDVAPVFKTVSARHVFYFLFWRKDLEYIDRYEALFRKYGITSKRYWPVLRKGGLYSPVTKVCEMLTDLNALPVIAHPGETRFLEEDVREIVGMGVRGIEVYTPKHDEEQTGYYGDVADRFGLVKTSGTDFHDPFHRNKVAIGRDQRGRTLTMGVRVADLKRLAQVNHSAR
jgi:predicted metal-dependent phosphoesterase TrpH